MLATITRLFAVSLLPPLPDVKPASPRRKHPPLFIGDVAAPRGQETELYHQLRHNEKGPQGTDERPPYE
jgi:hypothetical protein